jgi:hypothetical protein
MAWLAVFTLAAIGVYRRVRLTYLVVCFWRRLAGSGTD